VSYIRFIGSFAGELVVFAAVYSAARWLYFKKIRHMKDPFIPFNMLGISALFVASMACIPFFAIDDRTVRPAMAIIVSSLCYGIASKFGSRARSQ
jgi:hypothetical protein